MKYRIIGADGKTYGPIGIEYIRQWVSEGRADSRTPVYVEGASNWTYLGLLPELAGLFAQSSSAPSTIGASVSVLPMRATNGFATAGLVCSILSWLCCCCLPLSLLGLVFSIVALVQINSQAQPQEGRVFAILGIILSAGNLCFTIGAILLNLLLNPTAVTWQTHF